MEERLQQLLNSSAIPEKAKVVLHIFGNVLKELEHSKIPRHIIEEIAMAAAYQSSGHSVDRTWGVKVNGIVNNMSMVTLKFDKTKKEITIDILSDVPEELVAQMFSSKTLLPSSSHILH